MIANYHTHTYRCNHAKGADREYVEAALQAGLKILGFSDHAPTIFTPGYVSGVRMKPEELPEYVGSICALRQEFAGKIDIHVGLELEYYPEYLPRMLPILRDQPLEYLILGQHYVGSEVSGHPAPVATEDVRILEGYVNQCIEGMQTGMYTYFAHPDMLNFVGDGKIYVSQIRRLCREAKACGLPLEINLLGVLENRCYPRRLFWETASEEGCQAVIGRDAHKCWMLLDEGSEQKARRLAADCCLEVLDTVALKKPW